MIVSQIILKNWRNFQSVEVPLQDRVFLIGPNACGKSNFLDVFSFLRDIVQEGGGLQKAIQDRGGLSKIRSLSAQPYLDVEIEVHFAKSTHQEADWKYAIGIKQESRQPYLAYERVWKGKEQIIERPDSDDKKDKLRLTQTHLQQINANLEFRNIAQFFESVCHDHLVPQMVRYSNEFSGSSISGDPFGRNFLERVAKTQEKIRNYRLKKIEEGLLMAVPQFQKLTYIKDELGKSHLQALCEHWTGNGAKQWEDQFSDGTLRLIGLLWSLLESNSLLLLEEPELSLNAEIVKELPSLVYRLQKQRQVILSTHSWELLSDKGIAGEEVLLLTPTENGTQVELVSSISEIQPLLKAGLSIADAALGRTKPPKIEQMSFFK
ncbi:chromosome segregation protein SMC [Candidatus Thiomargarita nelsonii]|uniref:Chromosome segregation protein SMC n=1 Tax=Candidatus Thiomargarita nelsonii TaxID=1003181 RepID=A0A4E0QW83_9GAMM|nr:chromosome segregation protein SMC [Candidatus Thiomargarita nelsonii]